MIRGSIPEGNAYAATFMSDAHGDSIRFAYDDVSRDLIIMKTVDGVDTIIKRL